MGEAQSPQLGTRCRAGSPAQALGTVGWPGPSHFHPWAFLSPVSPRRALVEAAPWLAAPLPLARHSEAISSHSLLPSPALTSAGPRG